MTVNGLEATINYRVELYRIMPNREEGKNNKKRLPSLGRTGKAAPQLLKCPGCGEMTLFWDKCTSQGVCLNFNCKLSSR